MEDVKPLVLILCMTYNHEHYLEDALKGFVMQKTDFPFVAVVIDDASTDGTAVLLKKYEEQYPDIIKAVYLSENHYSIGKSKLPYYKKWKDMAKYIAICEGDDCWTDPLKLQMQVDILEKNPLLSSCFGGYFIHDNGQEDVLVDYRNEDGPDYSIYSLDDWAYGWFTKTLTGVIRISALEEYNGVRTHYKYDRDVHQCYYVLKWGPAAYVHRPLGIYNLHGGGVYGPLSDKDKNTVNYHCYKELFQYEKNEVLKIKYRNMIISCIKDPRSLKEKCRLIFEGLKVSRTFKEYYVFLKQSLV